MSRIKCKLPYLISTYPLSHSLAPQLSAWHIFSEVMWYMHKMCIKLCISFWSVKFFCNNVGCKYYFCQISRWITWGRCMLKCCSYFYYFYIGIIITLCCVVLTDGEWWVYGMFKSWVSHIIYCWNWDSRHIIKVKVY